jgi:hypothetical protein
MENEDKQRVMNNSFVKTIKHISQIDDFEIVIYSMSIPLRIGRGVSRKKYREERKCLVYLEF